MLGALAIHALVASLLAWTVGIPVGEGGRLADVSVSDRPVVRSLQVRSVTSSPELTPSALPATEGAESTAQARPAVSAAAVSSTSPAEESEEALMARLAREATEAAAAREAIAGASFEDYLSAARLTRRPQIQDPIQLPWPMGQGVPDGELYQGRFRVFIDDHGRVRRILGEGGNLLPPLVQLTLDTFQQARFAPGELEGRAVRSWIRIEVTFDARGVGSTRALN